MCKNIPELSPNIFRKIYHPGQEISLYWPNFSKNISQLTDKQTKNCDYLEIVYKDPRIVAKKFQEDVSSRTGDIHTFVLKLWIRIVRPSDKLET